MADLIDRKLFRKNNRDVFLLVLEYDPGTSKLFVKGSVPESVLEKIHIDFSEILADAPSFSTDKTAKFLEHIAHELYRMPRADLYCFDKSLLDKKGKIIRERLDNYRSALNYLNQENPDYISYNNNPDLCLYFKQVYARAQYESESFNIKYLRRKTFEALLITQEQISDYINCYFGLRFLRVESKCKEASFICAVKGKNVMLAFIDYGKSLRW